MQGLHHVQSRGKDGTGKGYGVVDFNEFFILGMVNMHSIFLREFMRQRDVSNYYVIAFTAPITLLQYVILLKKELRQYNI